MAAGQLYLGYSGAGHWMNGSVVTGCTVGMIPECLVPGTLHCLGGQITRAPGAILAPRLGMEGTMIKVDRYLARFWREAIVLHDLLTCWQ